MGPGEREFGCAVIESRRLPRAGRMARRAVVVKILQCMIRLGHLIEFALMATETVQRRCRVTGRVARDTIYG